MNKILKLIEKSKSGVKLLLMVIGFVVSLSATSAAQNSTESLTKPTTVEISQADADRCANNTRELIAARDEIKAYVAEINARDTRDKYSVKLIETYEKAVVLLDKVIELQNQVSADKDNLIRQQAELIKLLTAQKDKKDSPLK